MQHQPPQAFHSSNNGGEYHGGNVAPMRTLFVGDLSFFCNDEDLRSLFSSYGQVLSVEIKRGKATGDSLMHGFVEMDSEASAENALHHLRNQKFLGRRIRVSWGSGPSEEIQLFAQERDHWIQLHVSFVSRTSEVNINEELLDTLFCRFGEVADVTIKRHKPATESNSQSGYGFVFYANAIEALNAVKVMKHTIIDGITYDCSISYKSERALTVMRDPAIQQLLQDYRRSCSNANSNSNSSAMSATSASMSSSHSHTHSHSQSPQPSISDGQQSVSSSTASPRPVTHATANANTNAIYRSPNASGQYPSQQQQNYALQQQSHRSLPPPSLATPSEPPVGRLSPRDTSANITPASAPSSSISVSSSNREGVGSIAPRMVSSSSSSSASVSVAANNVTQAPLVSYQHQPTPANQQQLPQHPHQPPSPQIYQQQTPQAQHVMSPLLPQHAAPYPLLLPSNGTQSPPPLYMPIYHGSPMMPATSVAPPSGGYFISNQLPNMPAQAPTPGNHVLYNPHPYMSMSLPPAPMDFMDYNAAMHIQQNPTQYQQHPQQLQQQQNPHQQQYQHSNPHMQNMGQGHIHGHDHNGPYQNQRQLQHQQHQTNQSTRQGQGHYNAQHQSPHHRYSG